MTGLASIIVLSCATHAFADGNAAYMAHVEIGFPVPGGLVTPTFWPRFALVADDRFLQEYRDNARLCFAVGDAEATCVELDAASTVVDHARPGPTVMDAWVTDGSGGTLSHKTSRVFFEVASDEQMSTGKIADAQTLTADSLLAWYNQKQASSTDFHLQKSRADGQGEANTAFAQEQTLQNGEHVVNNSVGLSMGPLTASCSDSDAALIAVVGVKTAVGNFDRRQAARKTWTRADLGPHRGRACLKFITGRPGPELPGEVEAALALEAAVYGDLLDAVFRTGDVDHGISASGDLFGEQDGYNKLVAKTVGFMEVAIQQFAHFRYLVMVDDDVYLRVDRLVSWLNERAAEDDKRGFYAGQVWADELHRAIRPQRHPAPKNALAKEHWPLDVLPRFAIGPHYILSRYCVEFIVANKGWLRGVGTLEDVSVAVWMLALQVHPFHLNNFTDAKAGGCTDDAMSLANIGPRGFRAAHSNLAAGRPLCHGFEWYAWQVT